MSERVKVGTVQEIPPGSAKSASAGGRGIAVFNVGGAFHAIDATCKHRGGPLAEGEIEGTIVTCPWHGWQWDVTTGVGCTNPGAKLDCFRVEVVGDDLFVTA